MINHHDVSQKEQCSICTCGLCCTKINNFGVVRGKTEILRAVNLHIHCGDLTAIIGPNGAGKSTLLKAILGEISHTGTVEFVSAKKSGSERPVMGYVPQKLDFDISSPLSVLDLYAAAHSKRPVWLSYSKKVRERALEGLARVKVEHLVNRKLGALSGGELQRVLLALALDPIPDLLLLDEPVSGIDQNGLKLFYKTVSELRENYDLSVILVSHDLPLVAQFADRVVFINNKTVECCGNVKEVFGNKKVIETFGFDLVKGLNEKGGGEIND